MYALDLCENRTGDAAATGTAAPRVFCSWIIWTEKPSQGFLLILHSLLLVDFENTYNPISKQTSTVHWRQSEGEKDAIKDEGRQGPWTNVPAQGESLDLNFPYCSLGSGEITASPSNPPPRPLPFVLVYAWLCVWCAEGSKACCILLPLPAGLSHPHLPGLMGSRYMLSPVFFLHV